MSEMKDILRYPVAERFVSINGEGRKAGELSCFIRLYGCNLRCNYCDTAWAWEMDSGREKALSDGAAKNKGEDTGGSFTAAELRDWVYGTGVSNITLTGGEPLWREHMEELMEELLKIPEAEIEVETNGSIPLKPYRDISDRISFTMDLKCPGSGMAAKNHLENLDILRERDVVKFVVSGKDDLDWTKDMIRNHQLTEKCLVYLSSAFGRITPAEMVDYMKEHAKDYGMNRVRLQLQLHKYIWDPMKKGV